MKFLLLITLMATTFATSTQASVSPVPYSSKKLSPLPVITWTGFAFTNVSYTSLTYHFATSYEYNVVKIEIERYHVGSSGWQIIDSVFASGPRSYSYTDVGLIIGETYQYRVRGVSSDDSRTPWSIPYTVTMLTEE